MKPWEQFSNTSQDNVTANDSASSPKPWEKFNESSSNNEVDNSINIDTTAPAIQIEEPQYTQSSDNTTTMTLPEMKASIQQGKDNEAIPGQVIAGARQATTLPLAKLIEDGLGKIGIDVGHESTENLAKINKYIKDYEDAHPNQTIHPSTVGNIISQLAVPYAKGVKAVAATEGVLSALQGIGENNNYSDVGQDAAIGAVFGATAAKAFSYLPESLRTKLGESEEGLTKQAKLLLKLNQGRLSEEEAIKQLKGIPKKDQVITLAESIDLAKNYFSKAVDDNSILATKLGKRLEQRKNIIEPFTANEVDLQQAQKTFGEMRKSIDETATGILNTEPLVDILEPLRTHYATDPSVLGTSVRNILLDLSDDTLTAGKALDIRENINMLLRKPAVKKSGKTKDTLMKVKNSLDTFLGHSITPEQNQLIQKEIGKYRETINNKLFGDLIKKNTKSDYAVNWEALNNDIRKEGLSSKSINMVTPILKEFEKKFANDKYLGNVITPKGAGEGIGLLGAWSKVVQMVLNMASPVFNRSRYKDLQIQKAITSSIKHSDNPLDFVENLVKRKVVTKEQYTEIQKELKQIEYKPSK